MYVEVKYIMEHFKDKRFAIYSGESLLFAGDFYEWEIHGRPYANIECVNYTVFNFIVEIDMEENL